MEPNKLQYFNFLSQLYRADGKAAYVENVFCAYERVTHSSGMTVERLYAAMRTALILDGLLHGGTCMNQKDFYNKTARLLQLSDAEFIANIQKVECAERGLINQFALAKEQTADGIFYSQYSIAGEEQVLLQQVKRFLKSEKRLNIMPEQLQKALDALMDTSTIQLSEDQKNAILNVAVHGISLVYGGPGTGKTTMLDFLIKAVRQCSPDAEIKLLAPTGKAARRLEAATKEPASTMHSYLKWKFRKDTSSDKEDIFSCDLLVIDESSMIPLDLMRRLLFTVKPDTRIIFLGDYNQLPPISAGKPFRDMVQSGVFPCTKLSAYHRQEPGCETILTAAKRIVGAERIPLFPFRQNTSLTQAFHFIEKNSIEDIRQTTIETIKTLNETMGFDFRDIQVLSPVHFGGCGTKTLNSEIKRIVNPSTPVYSDFFIGDTVVYGKNNSTLQLTNGEIGIVQAVIGKKVEVDFGDKIITLPKTNLTLAYTMTVCKAQGSEFPVTIVPLHTYMNKALTRSMLYTALTRGKKKVIVIGEKAAVKQAVATDTNRLRTTLLEYHLKTLCAG